MLIVKYRRWKNVEDMRSFTDFNELHNWVKRQRHIEPVEIIEILSIEQEGTIDLLLIE